MLGILMISKERCSILGGGHIIFFCLIFASICLLSSGRKQSALNNGGHCVWYGECNYTTGYFRKVTHKNCLNYTVAQPLVQKGLDLLSKDCPDFVNKTKGVMKTCCDYNQVLTLHKEINNLTRIKNCPGCVKNIKNHLCNVYCSPHQSDFINVTSTKWLNGQRHAVDRIQIYVSNKYINGTLQSCRGAKNDRGRNFLNDFWSSKNINARTALSFFNAMGKQAPFEMVYVNATGKIDRYSPLDLNTTSHC